MKPRTCGEQRYGEAARTEGGVRLWFVRNSRGEKQRRQRGRPIKEHASDNCRACCVRDRPCGQAPPVVRRAGLQDTGVFSELRNRRTPDAS